MTDYNKYIKIRDFEHDSEMVLEHYIYCNENNLPYIIVKEKTNGYATIIVEYITISPEIDRHGDIVSERFGDWIDDAIRNDFLKEGEFNTWGICPQITVKKQCADHYAELAFNIYVDLWKSIKPSIKEY